MAFHQFFQGKPCPSMLRYALAMAPCAFTVVVKTESTVVALEIGICKNSFLQAPMVIAISGIIISIDLYRMAVRLIC
jgi:hypothetical protein